MKRDYNTYLINTMIALALSAIIVSCGHGKIETISTDAVKNIPSEQIDSLRITATENGKLRYKLVAELANKYQFVDTPYYDFPRGLHASSYIDGVLEADIVADSAVWRSNPDFFVAYGNVVVRNVKKQTRVETQGPLFWDASKKLIYTSVFSTVYTLTDTLPAHNGLSTDDQFKRTDFHSVQWGRVNREFTTKDSTAKGDTVTASPMVPAPAVTPGAKPDVLVKPSRPRLERIKPE